MSEYLKQNAETIVGWVILALVLVILWRQQLYVGRARNLFLSMEKKAFAVFSEKIAFGLGLLAVFAYYAALIAVLKGIIALAAFVPPTQIVVLVVFVTVIIEGAVSQTKDQIIDDAQRSRLWQALRNHYSDERKRDLPESWYEAEWAVRWYPKTKETMRLYYDMISRMRLIAKSQSAEQRIYGMCALLDAFDEWECADIDEDGKEAREKLEAMIYQRDMTDHD